MHNKQSIAMIRQVLHDLLNGLPAIRAHRSPEAVKRHLAMIAYYQRQYDRLLSLQSPPQPA